MADSSDGEASPSRRRSDNRQGNTPAANAANVGRGEQQLPICAKIEEALNKALALTHVPPSDGPEQLQFNALRPLDQVVFRGDYFFVKRKTGETATLEPVWGGDDVEIARSAASRLRRTGVHVEVDAMSTYMSGSQLNTYMGPQSVIHMKLALPRAAGWACR